MKSILCFGFGLALSIVGCGGNVSVDSTSGGGGGAGGGTTTGTTTGTGNDFTSCDGPGQCVLAVPGCCSGCGVPEVGDFAAVNSAKLDAYHTSVCPEETPCPACEGGINPNLFAYCDAGKCVAADVRTHAVSACATSADCHLRVGAGCCEGCGPVSESDLTVTSNAVPGLEALVCGPNAGCPECAPQYPPDVAPSCGGDGHCELVLLDN